MRTPLKNPSLTLYEHLPEIAIEESGTINGLHEAVGILDGERVYFYYCPHCKGWVKGWPDEEREQSLGYLSGRRGIAYSCKRCGREIGFFGAVS